MSNLFDAILGPINPGSSFFVAYLAVAVLIGAAQLVVSGKSNRSGLLSALFPKDVLWHPSARTDYVYFFLRRLTYSFMAIAATALTITLAGGVLTILQASSPGGWIESLAGTQVIVTVGLLLAADASGYLAHRLSHEVPVLWEFHKVHHSAEVLVPATAERFHPIDDLFLLIVGAVGQGVTLAMLEWVLVARTPAAAIYGLNLGYFLFYATGFHLRHSHIWLSYGRRVERLLISPGMHQLHHSVDPDHYDSNYGLALSVWDVVGGTHLSIDEPDNLVVGLGPAEDKDYRTVRQILIMPFLKLRSR